jgi:hypothetical protein
MRAGLLRSGRYLTRSHSLVHETELVFHHLEDGLSSRSARPGVLPEEPDELAELERRRERHEYWCRSAEDLMALPAA